LVVMCRMHVMKGIPQAVLALFGRLLLVAIFLMSALGSKIPHFNATVKTMNAEGVPLPAVALASAIAFLLIGSVLVVLGWKTRLGAALLLLFLALATFFFHDFWNFSGDAVNEQQIQFGKNLAIAGGLVLLIAHGPGRLGVGLKKTKNEGK